MVLSLLKRFIMKNDNSEIAVLIFAMLAILAVLATLVDATMLTKKRKKIVTNCY